MTPATLPPFAFTAITGSAVPTQPSLQPGTVLSALVVANVDASTLRLLLGSETLDLVTDRLLAPGTPVELVVEGTPSRPELGLRPLPESRAQAPSPPQPSPSQLLPSQSSQSHAVQRATPAAPASSSAQAIEAAVKSVAALLGSAAVRQGGLAPLYANLESALARPNLSVPQSVAAAAQQLLSLRLDLGGDGDVDAAGIKAALHRSGLVSEPSAVPNGQSTPGQADLRAALQALRETLKGWAAAEPLPQQRVEASPPSLQSGPHTAPRGSGVVPPVPNLPSAPLASHSDRIQPNAAASPPIEDAMPSQPPPSRPVGGTRGAEATTVPNAPQRSTVFDGYGLYDTRPSPPGQAGLRAALQALSETLQSWDDAPPPASQEPAQSFRNPYAPFAAPRAANLAPPFRNAPMEPQPAAPPTVLADASPGEIARHLLDDTDAAIARQTLLQIASLPDEQGGGSQPARDPASNMTFEIPLSVGQGTAVAQLRIERDGAERHGDTVDPVWRVNFSIDLEPIGPVHARISLTGDRAAVFLKAERPESADRLAQDLPLLEAGLRGAELEPGTLLCRTGAPDAPFAAAGLFLDHAT